MAGIRSLLSPRYEPMPRMWHTSCQIGSEVILYSGLTKDYSEKTKRHLASAVDVFDMYTELWQRKKVTGEGLAPGAYSAASASVADDLFMFGGNDGRRFYNSLHRLKGGSKWTQVCPQNEKTESPMAKYGAGMVAFGDNLAVLGGYGVQSLHWSKKWTWPTVFHKCYVHAMLNPHTKISVSTTVHS